MLVSKVSQLMGRGRLLGYGACMKSVVASCTVSQFIIFLKFKMHILKENVFSTNHLIHYQYTYTHQKLRTDQNWSDSIVRLEVKGLNNVV